MMYPYLCDLPIRVGERFCADRIRISCDKNRGKKRKRNDKNSKKKYLFLIVDTGTPLCIFREVAYGKNGHNTTALLGRAKNRTGKIPAEFVTDILTSYGQVHDAVYTAKMPAGQIRCTYCRCGHQQKAQQHSGNV